MNTQLEQLQSSWMAAMLDPHARAADAVTRFQGGIRSPDQGLAVYVNNIRANVVAALEMTFPATCRLLGAAAFRRAVIKYLRAMPPRTGDLGDYGQELWLHVDEGSPGVALDVIHEVARYEWLIDQLRRRAREAHWTFALASQIPADEWPSLRLGLVTHAHLVCTRICVRAWVLHALRDAQAPFNGGEQLLLVAGDEDVNVLELTPAEYRFVSCAGGHTTLEIATQAALREASDFDLRAVLTKLLSIGALVPPLDRPVKE